MPGTVDRNEQPDSDRDRDDKSSKNKSSASKSKDLSHVPCKFFKVGSCTAGSSCPFSHNMQEPGAQKDVCAWFVKGNCKFGHKCALAHILPGQSMAMDRKNKKAAQVAANASKESNGTSKRGKKDNSSSAIGKNALLTSAAVSRAPGRPPITMPLKAAISAPAPASVLKDTDFASSSAQGSEKSNDNTLYDPNSASALPLSSPRRPAPSPHNPSKDYGPIGSPPRSIPNAGRNEYHAGTSPSQRGPNGTAFLSSSPFGSGGIATSLGSVAVDMNRSQAPSGSASLHGNLHDEFDDSTITRRRKGELPIDEDELQDFVPSSLTDLLTPEEMNRRMSRSSSGQNVLTTAGIGGGQNQSGTDSVGVPVSGLKSSTSGLGGGHRYSRSVPSQTLLGDLSSIWSADKGPSPNPYIANAGLPASPSRLAHLGNGGTPSSFTSSGFGGRALAANAGNGGSNYDPLSDELDPATIAMLSPTNASAAFLPGFHQHYKAQQGTTSIPPGRGARNVSNPLFSGSGQHASGLATATGYAVPAGSTQTQNFSAISSSVYDPPSQMASTTQVRPIPSQIPVNHNDSNTILSPNARALQAHAPGQSLPQGLAAGYSRIHALPSLPSPGSIGTGSVGGGFSISPGPHNAIGQYTSTDWAASPPGSLGGMGLNGLGGAGSGGNNMNSNSIETMFSKLTYSAAASGNRPQPLQNSSNTASPPGISKNATNNGGGRWGSGPLSPLSGPVVTGDDDIFSMDG